MRGPELYADIAINDDGLGGAPCWVSACLRRSTFLWKARPHRVQANGLKPECLRRWVIRLDDCEKVFPHSLHTYGFSPMEQIYNQLVLQQLSWIFLFGSSLTVKT